MIGIMPDANEYIEWAGKTRVEMVEDVIVSEAKKPEFNRIFTRVFENLMKIHIEMLLEDLKRPSLLELFETTKKRSKQDETSR